MSLRGDEMMDFGGLFRHEGFTTAVGQLASASVLVELLGPLVERDSLSATVDDAESGDPELLSGLHDRSGPSTAVLKELLAACELLLGHHLAVFVEHQVLLGQPALGVGAASVPNPAV